VQVLGRLKLVNPPAADLQRGDDGLFRMRNGNSADTDPKVSLTSGALEGSNVNVVEAMVNMIALSRSFEMHMKFLENAEANDRQASSVLSAR
jgi:flagellar basal-body rod protein FlgF